MCGTVLDPTGQIAAGPIEGNGGKLVGCLKVIVIASQVRLRPHPRQMQA